jgi:hypothetical protein
LFFEFFYHAQVVRVFTLTYHVPLDLLELCQKFPVVGWGENAITQGVEDVILLVDVLVEKFF